MKTIRDVLDELYDGPIRGNYILCPSHDDQNPSCKINEGGEGENFVFCFSCGWTADAAGLEAQLRGVGIEQVLAEYRQAGFSAPAKSREKVVPARSLRDQIWIDWVVWSTEVIRGLGVRLRTVYGDVMGAELMVAAMMQTDEVFADVVRACRPGSLDDEIAPYRVGQVVNDAKGMLTAWSEQWLR